jgi:hypothetical protein
MQTNFQCLQILEEEGYNERCIATPRRARSAALLTGMLHAASLAGGNWTWLQLWVGHR